MNSSSRERRALAILPNWLGDLVMVAPALASLRERGPLLGLGSQAGVELLRALGVLDAAVVYERRRERGPLGVLRAGRRGRPWRPEVAYVFGPSLRAAALAFASGARERVGFSGEGRALFLTRPLGAMRRDTHLAAQWMRMAGGAGSPRERLPLQLDAAAQTGWKALRGQHEGLRGDYVAFAAGASYGPTKRWPHFEALARDLAQALGATPLFVGGPDAGERALCAELAASCDGVDLAGRTDLPTLAALLQDARLFVGNDSGPMHLAAALGTPTLGIFGSSSPAWTAPMGPRATHVGPAPIDCAPCFAPHCSIGIRCLTELSVATVRDAALELL